MADPYLSDCKALLVEVKHEDSRLRLKRRLLMNLPLSCKEEKWLKELNALSDKSIPESLLREDDEYYDKIKNFVERGLGSKTTSGKEKHAVCPEELFKNGTVKDLSPVLDRMRKKGLCSLSKLVTKGSRIKFKKTKLEMKNIIKKHLPSYLDCENRDLLEARKYQISTLLNYPHHLSGKRENRSSSTEHFCGCAISVLDMLEELSPTILRSMLRRLTSLEESKALQKPMLKSHVRSHCMKMLGELNENNPIPPESLVEALSMAGVTLKLLFGHTDIPEFKQFSPEVEALQNNILKAIVAIKDLDKTVLEVASKKLLIFSEPREGAMRKRNSRIGLRNRLVEYLVECGCMESIPKPLVEVLNDINNPFYSSSNSSNEVKEEVDFLLCLSAQIKQVIWDNNVISGEEFDKDFATAYMDESDDGDDDYFELDDCNSMTEECVGETNSPDQLLGIDEENDPVWSNGLKTKREDKPEGHTQGQSGKNKYLWIQRACDETAMTMYHTVDGILKELKKD